ncbi:hypothetical protein [Membranihabitans maritimus]|uniref:hypothetical protein n=1 Tax=Membranihabitans maritimus TaxID=2904244 RepID=UPI001F206822|nr:hypothetical protein [Membranihabitans maritimus]
MNKNLNIIVFVCLMMVAVKENLSAQLLVSQSKNIGVSIGDIAIMDIEPSGEIQLATSSISEAGLGFSQPLAEDQSKWINYSCSDRSGNTKRIDVNVTAGSIPDGLILKLTAANYLRSGDGVLGISTGEKVLTSAPQVILDNIVRGYTGSGAGNGHRLTYTLEVDEFGDLSESSAAVVTVHFTITDN